MKVIVHYTNGQTYEIKDLFICHTDWEGNSVTIEGENVSTKVYTGLGVNLAIHDVLFLEEVDKECGAVKLYFNPNIEMSVKVDVMTAKARSKACRSDILSALGQTRKAVKNLFEKVDV